MIEKTVLDYLTSKMTEPIYTERNGQKGKFYIIEKVGGGETNHIKRASIVVQSLADSMYDAALMNESVKEVMKDIVALPEVSSCKLDSDYNFTDTTTKKYRYQAVFDLIHY